jgi:hypothetical protein
LCHQTLYERVLLRYRVPLHQGTADKAL